MRLIFSSFPENRTFSQEYMHMAAHIISNTLQAGITEFEHKPESRVSVMTGSPTTTRNLVIVFPETTKYIITLKDGSLISLYSVGGIWAHTKYPDGKLMSLLSFFKFRFDSSVSWINL